MRTAQDSDALAAKARLCLNQSLAKGLSPSTATVVFELSCMTKGHQCGSSPIGMCLSRHQGLTPKRNQVDCLWPCPCLKSRASKLAPESKHEARTARQISVATRFLTPLRRVCANRVILLKLAERQQAQFGYLIMHPQPQTVGIQQTFHSIQASQAAMKLSKIEEPFC